MATLKEISERTGLSIATVSKVLNGRPGVNRETCDFVLAAAKELNYRPNLTARNLKRGSSRTLGIITEDLTVFNTPEIVDGIDVCCEDHGFHYILGNLRLYKRFGNEPVSERERMALVQDMVETMLSKQVDGIVFVGMHSHVVAPVKAFAEIKSVCAYCSSADPDIPSVVYDDQRAAYEVAELLIREGHTKIGMIAGPVESQHTTNRTLGFQEALYAHNLPYNPHLTCFGDWERDRGFTHAAALLKEGVTAIFAQNDLMAMGVIDYCTQNGIEVGRDVSLIGFDNLEISTVCRPKLSTVSLPLFEIGHTAARILLDNIEGKSAPEDRRIRLGCRIVERESTCRLNTSTGGSDT